MSKATKRKHVTREVLEEFVLPDENRTIVKVLAGRGNNLHEVETKEGDTFLVSMPTKFRKNVWIKRGDFVLVQPIEEGDRVKAEISHILYKEQVKHIKEEGLWPKKFEDLQTHLTSDNMIPDDMLPPDSDEEEGDSDDGADFMCVNPNRRVRVQVPTDDDSEEEEEEEKDEEESSNK